MLKVAPCAVARSNGPTTKFFRLDGLLLLLFRIVMGLRSASSAIILVDKYCIRKIALVAVQGNNGETGTTGMWSGDVKMTISVSESGIVQFL